MMNISTQMKEALIMLGIVAVVVYVATPKGTKSNKISKPDVADDKELTQKENARVALDAFMTAVESKETPANLQKLNNELAQTYGLRVYRNGKYFVAKDSAGQEILYAK